MRRGNYVAREEREVTFGVYYERWLASRQISSSRAYTDAIRAGFTCCRSGRTARCGSIRPSDVDDWIAALSRKMGPHSVRHCYTLFRGPLRRAIKDRLIDDPCIDVPLPKKPDRRKIFDDVWQTYVERVSKTEDCRTIPVPQPVMDRLLEHLATYCPDAGREDFLFLTRNGTHPLRANVARDVLRAAVRRAGLQRHVTWLTLRHTAASLMFDAGLTLFEVQQRLGHKSPPMTAEVYTHLMRERFDEGRQHMKDYMLTKRRADPTDSPRRLGS